MSIEFDDNLRTLEVELLALPARLGITGDLAVAWRFGGPAAPYAVYVHEIPPPPQKSEGGRSARHAVGGWKFMERPLADAAPGIPFAIAAAVRSGEGLEAAVYAVAESLLMRMKEATPVEFGALRNSGHIVTGAAALSDAA